MAVALDPVLQARMNSMERIPIAQIISTSFASSIPFAGNDFDLSNSALDLDPDIKYLSTGELVNVSVNDVSADTIRFMITDTSREQWKYYNIDVGLGIWDHLYGTTCCEMPNGNIAIAFRTTYNGKFIRVTWVTKTGTWVGANYTVVSRSASDTIYDPYLIYNDNISKYQLFYTVYDSANTAYRVYMVETDNLTSWEAPVEITPSSFGTGKKYNNIHAIVLSDDDIAVSFEYTDYLDPVSGFELTNVYYIISTDNGSTWTDPTAVTTYDTIGKAARHPTIAEKSTGSIYFTFHDRVTFVVFDKSTDGVISDCGGSFLNPQDLHMYNGYLYLTSADTNIGAKTMCGMYIVDPLDMSLEAQYTSTTVPGYNSVFKGTSWWHQSWGAGKYMVRNVTSVGGGCWGAIVVVANDFVTESVTEYVLGHGCGLPAYGLDENVYIEPPTAYNAWKTTFAWIDADADRLYVWLRCSYTYALMACYGFIDLTEVPDEQTGYYTWNELYRKSDSSLNSSYGMGGCNLAGCQNFYYGRYCKEDDVIVLCAGDQTSWDENVAVLVISAKTGIIQFCGNRISDSNIPYNSLRSAYVYNNKIYGSFTYTSSYGQEDWRGLFIYDILTGSKQTVRPAYAVKNQYTFSDYDFGDIANNHIWIASSDGALRYNTGSQTFTRYSKEELPGWDMGDGGSGCEYICWDPVNEDVYVSKMNSYAQTWNGVRRFNVNGDYRKGQYLLGQKVLTDLNLSNQQDLTLGYFELNIVTAVDDEDVLWVHWDHIDNADDDRDFYWDNDKGESEITDDLTDVIEIAWDLEIPTELRFSLANGHKYDQQNSLSSLNSLCRKGKKIIPKLGEKIDGVNYYVQQGVFIIEEAKMTYAKKNHPVLEVVARDISSLWQQNRVVLTEYYDNQTPKYILTSLLEGWTVFEDADYDIPDFETSHKIWNQWQDESFYDIIKSLLDHLEYIISFDTNGVFTPRRLEFDKAVDHTYSNTLQITEYSPDTSFSSFVNTVRVIGETHDFLEIVYEAENVGNVNGTVGWWNVTVTHTIYYNEERTRKCRNPYIVANISTGDFRYFGAKFGGKEYISYVDPEELYCIVTIVGPNLIGVVVALALSFIFIGGSALDCCLYCGPWIFASCMTANLLIYALLAVATYDLEIWAMPVGKQKQTIQAIAIDQDYKDLMNGQEVTEEIEDVFCYDVAECQRVANYELSLLKYQRERIQFGKITHLQDEKLDMVLAPHPYSGQYMRVVVANLVRTLVIRGEMTDRIEGWRIL